MKEIADCGGARPRLSPSTWQLQRRQPTHQPYLSTFGLCLALALAQVFLPEMLLDRESVASSWRVLLVVPPGQHRKLRSRRLFFGPPPPGAWFPPLPPIILRPRPL